jgi:hypothetical protein
MNASPPTFPARKQGLGYEGLYPIYELPTRSSRKYRGKYPERVHSAALGRVCHFELNNGRRFVALSSFVVEQPSYCGKHISKVLRPIGVIRTMDWGDYAGVLFVIRTIRTLRKLTAFTNEHRATYTA